MKITISKSDLLRGETITPGWYEAIVEKVVVAAPKSGGDSLNFTPFYKIPSLDNRELKGNPPFNSQAMSNMAPFVAAIRKVNLKEVIDGLKADQGLDFDTDEATGAKIQIKIVNEPYNGRMTNKVDGFLPTGVQPPF